MTQTQTPELNIGGATLAAAPAAAPAPEARPLREAKPADAHGWWWGTGRRKTAVARVRLRPAKPGAKADEIGGEGRIRIQKTGGKFVSVETLFTEERDRADVYAPLKLTDTFGKVEIFIRAHGGGLMGQAGAIKLGISRALIDYDPNTEAALRDAGFLTRDAREVERKKYGQAGARRRFQFSKR